MASHAFAQYQEKTSALVVRVAVFSNDQGGLDRYRDFIDGHLFPTLWAVPGYVGTFLGRDANGQLISLSFWRSEADAAAGEEAVGRVIRGLLPPGSAPRPSKVEKYVVEYRDLKEPLK